MTFTLSLSPLTWALLAVAVAAAATCIIWLWVRERRLHRFVTVDAPLRNRLAREELPPVSVLVYTRNEAEWLSRFLPALLHQDYPAYEVIVVDDASSDGTKDLVSDMLTQHAHLRTTSIPEGTRSLSRKKLSLMLGIKAAKHDIIVTTSANCRVTGEHWLEDIARNFVPGVDVVIGYSHYRYSRDKRLGRRYRILDSVMTGAQYLGSAIKGAPYRGVADNLAYRKQTFFDNTGFSRSLDLKWGDDDVFVSEIAHGGNTRVELERESIVHAYYENVARAHYELKLHRDFTTSQLPVRKPFVAQGAFSAVHYLLWGALIAAAALNPCNVAVLAAVAVIAIAAWLLTGVPVRRLCRLLDAPALLLTVPALLLWRPVVNLWYRLRGRRVRQSNYTSIID